MSHYSTELLVRERITNWQRDAGMERLVRADVEGEQRSRGHSPSRQPRLPTRMAGWLAPVRRFVTRAAPAV